MNIMLLNRNHVVRDVYWGEMMSVEVAKKVANDEVSQWRWLLRKDFVV